jgi:hypothetical protein
VIVYLYQSQRCPERTLGAVVFTWQIIAFHIVVLTVDRIGRRKLMLTSCLGMGISMAILARTVSQPDNRAAINVAGVFIFIFSEIFPIRQAFIDF